VADKPVPPCCECGKPAYCTYRRANSRKRDAFCAECEGKLIYQGYGRTVAEAGVPPAQNSKAKAVSHG
jgi:hypothetical protein